LPYQGEFETEEDLVRIIKEINAKVNMQPNQTNSSPTCSSVSKRKRVFTTLAR